MRVSYDGAQPDLDRKGIDHDTTARGDKLLDCSPDVLDKQIDSRTLPLGLQYKLSVSVGQTQPHLMRTPPLHLVSQTLVERNAGLKIADRKLQAIELAYERRVRRSTHDGQSRSRLPCGPPSGIANEPTLDSTRTRPEQALTPPAGTHARRTAPGQRHRAVRQRSAPLC